MSSVGLMYVGAVLFVNSLMLFGKIDGKSAGVFNLFVGAIQVISPLYLIFTANGDSWVIFNASGIFLFGFTYLYVGITNLKNYDSSGVGWYSLWVAILAVGYASVSFIHFNDVKFGIIWLMWSFLWTLFYLLLSSKKNIGIFTGWVALIQSWITAAIPAFLILIGQWDAVGPKTTWGITILTILLFIVVYLFTKPHVSSKVSEMKSGA
ncbi:AmiS/UreI family transporter [Domibacillus mangrovi]|uniref:Transporter n=1 Tax=Domibacillus mangrovi TaxID=1714354 RepID=A0A1Q5NZA7_9BACI|nr:AmiS/UreI family transporter [Domibacillus mangrovi]OKL35347.1 transporter [Domibacillus mangrovi]